MDWTVAGVIAGTLLLAGLIIIRRGDRCPHCGHFKGRHAPSSAGHVESDFECLECGSKCHWE